MYPPLEQSAPLTAIVLTKNEEKHIERCLLSIRTLCAKIVVVDSESTDRTREIAESLGATVIVRPWPGQHAAQFNFGLDAADVRTPWTLRIDADEYFTPELRAELSATFSRVGPEVTGLVVPRMVKFQGVPIRFGGFYPQWLLRIWRTGTARSEQRLMDEHMVLQTGRQIRLSRKLIDDNLNDISWWTEKHLGYARREAAELVMLRYGLSRDKGPGDGALAGAAARKRFIKEKIYSHLPLGARAMMYFIYRFVLRFGFLDRPRVWVFHFLQAAWYRTLVDVMVGEFQTAVGQGTRQAQRAYLRERWGIRLDEDG